VEKPVCFMDSHGPFAHESASLPSWEEARTTSHSQDIK
jgi:hypothetical protein